MAVCGPSLFGDKNRYIKLGNGEFVAIDGSNIMERLNLKDVRIPYEQVLKARIILKPEQEDYFLNYLGLGDNVTFLAIKATYDQKSLEKDKYVSYKPYNDVNNESYFSQMMVLTGNSAKRVPQLFLSNPSDKYNVILDIMIAIIDDNLSFYDYRPVVFFTSDVTLENTDYSEPFNTSLGEVFGASFSPGLTYSKSDLIDDLVTEVKDSNGNVMSLDNSNYLLYDSDDLLVDGQLSSGTYSLKFDITDNLNNSVSPLDVVNIFLDEP